jgi:superfamily II RNA helicase
MSFVPAPQKATPAGNASAQNGGNVTNSAADAAVAEVTAGVEDAFITSRTFDVYWVDKNALMYKDGIVKKYDREERKAVITTKVRSSIPIILRDMAPPEGSIFDPAKKWEEEQERRKRLTAATEAESKEDKKKNVKKNTKKTSTADAIKESNAAEKSKKDLERDLMKLSNLRTLKALQDANCDTPLGKIHRMVKMLHLAVSDLKQGSVGSSEAEVLDILWALEEMTSFKNAESEISAEKKNKKDSKDDDKKSKKDSKKDSKKEKDGKKSKDKEEKKEKVVLSADAKGLKDLLKENGDKFKDSLKYARKLMSGKKDIISFQLTQMADRLPPLSRYNRAFKLENWQCDILSAIDQRKSAVVCAPTSSGKTLLSTYTCKQAKGTVLFVLPSEVLVWQIAATYYEFFKGNVTVATDLITFQEITGDAQVFIGTPRAVEKALIKARGAAGQEMKNGQREFMILDGGYSQFDYLVLDEVHTLNGPEGDALQRIIRCCNCPFLALSATIGNAKQLQAWLSKVRNEHVVAELVDVVSEEVFLEEYFV